LGSELACKTTALIRAFVLLVIKDLSLHISLQPPLVRINLFLHWLAERNRKGGELQVDEKTQTHN